MRRLILSGLVAVLLTGSGCDRGPAEEKVLPRQDSYEVAYTKEDSSKALNEIRELYGPNAKREDYTLQHDYPGHVGVWIRTKSKRK
ncbi:MAG: hypothetical protein KJ905_02280 [Nanoarchaeota archaeon]|nr:hypothetical protein [Nanoarchaeota archaeon]MBU1501578.1 hypothetical protein [Nanoarchaeota archaeon]MBU2459010.1 hypothetical protein [Nanoarchaeota archaeon]